MSALDRLTDEAVEDLKTAAESGRYLITIHWVAEKQLQYRRHEMNFPMTQDGAKAVGHFLDDMEGTVETSLDAMISARKKR